MKERILLLLREIEDLNLRQNNLYEKIDRSWKQFEESKEYSFLVESAFYLNQLYSGFERIFQYIAEVFENTIEGSRWHKNLLERMRLNIEPLRPALIRNDTYQCLDDLRTFRHFFRHAYEADLDPEKVSLVMNRAMRLRDFWSRDLTNFTNFLNKLAEE